MVSSVFIRSNIRLFRASNDECWVVEFKRIFRDVRGVCYVDLIIMRRRGVIK